jgi:hypothetical protein
MIDLHPVADGITSHHTLLTAAPLAPQPLRFTGIIACAFSYLDTAPCAQ